MGGELWKLDATAQAALVRARDVTAAELVEVAIDRIERLNPAINAVVTPLFDEARRAAERPPDGPFRGVPLLVKDASLQIEGTPYYVGTEILRRIGHRSTRTTELARRLRAAGFVFMGKTNVPELSSGISTEPPAFGPTRNPWDLGRTAGGSSGGSAAAVAAGMTSIAHGADGTGSLRYPAACCGVVTLKPTSGRVPSETPDGSPDPLGIWAEFVITRSARDLAGVFRAVADGEALPAPGRPLRVGLLKHDAMSRMPVDAACVAGVERVGHILQSAGHAVDETHPPALDDMFVRLAPSSRPLGPSSDLPALIALARRAQVEWLASIAGRPLEPGDVSDRVLAEAASADRYDETAAASAAEALREAIAPVHEWWAEYDLLVTPTTRQPAWPLGSKDNALQSGTFPGAFSFSGQPAMSVPAHWSNAGLPVGVQIVGARGRDELLLDVAAVIEEATGWRERWPAIALSETPEGAGR